MFCLIPPKCLSPTIKDKSIRGASPSSILLRLDRINGVKSVKKKESRLNKEDLLTSVPSAFFFCLFWKHLGVLPSSKVLNVPSDGILIPILLRS